MVAANDEPLHTIFSSSVNDLNQCAERCDSDLECTLFQFDSTSTATSTTCTLMINQSGSKTVALGSGQSFDTYHTKTLATARYSKEADKICRYPKGSTMAEVGETTERNEERCAEQCDAIYPKCTLFLWNKNTKKC